MRAKDVEFDVTYINLREKPDWFLKISPHGKVPVLLVEPSGQAGQVPLFESGALRPVIDSRYSFEQLPEAHTYMESNANIGKILIDLA